MFKIGDKVLCVKDPAGYGWKEPAKGAVYTVQNLNPRFDEIELLEMPYSGTWCTSRFILASTPLPILNPPLKEIYENYSIDYMSMNSQDAPTIKCQCGQTHNIGIKHSDYCPLYEK